MKRQQIMHLGCPGHFIGASRCHWRRHTQIGSRYRVSTVGDYYGGDDKRETLGSDDDSWFETMVFNTTSQPVPCSEGCGCLQCSFVEIDGRRYSTAGAAQAGHEHYVRKYAKKARDDERRGK